MSTRSSSNVISIKRGAIDPALKRWLDQVAIPILRQELAKENPYPEEPTAAIRLAA